MVLELAMKKLMRAFNGSMRCSFFSLKTACLFIAYFLLFIQAAGAVATMFICTTNATFEQIADASKDEFWLALITVAIVVSMVFLIAVAILSFTVLLIIGLHKDDRKFIKIYLVFSVFTMIISIVFCFVSEFVFVMNPMDTLQRVLSVAVNGIFLYIIRMYWIKLEPIEVKMIGNQEKA